MAGYTARIYKDEDPINLEAANKLGRLFDTLKANGYEIHALKVFLVRLLFILFTEDTGICQKDLFRWCIETLRPAQFDSDAREALLNAHQRLDKGVDACYGRRTFTTELERVTYLFELYQQLTAPLAKAPPVKAGAS